MLSSRPEGKGLRCPVLDQASALGVAANTTAGPDAIASRRIAERSRLARLQQSNGGLRRSGPSQLAPQMAGDPLR